MGLFNPNTGSWSVGGVQLPDFGVTETLSKIVGVPTTYQGGSNLYGDYPTTPEYIANINQAQQLADTRVASPVTYKAPTTNTNTNTNTNTGGGNYMDYYSGWDANQALQDFNKVFGGDINKLMTARGVNTGGTSGPSQEELALNASRNAFNSAYDPVYQQLDSMIGNVPSYQANREQQVNDLYGSQQNEITGARNNSISALDASRTNVATKQAQSVRDLQENMRNMLQAGNIQLGIGGAGDSSAANMYAYALSKQAGRNSADISNQASSQYAAIDSQGQQIRAVADDNLAKLGTWKVTSLNSVKQWAQDQISSLESMKLNATAEKAKALAANQVNVINQALSNLQQIDSQYTTWQSNLNNWALERLASLDDAKAKMSGYGNYSAQDIVAKELQGMNGTASGVTSSANMTGYNPWQKQKDEYTSFLNNYGR